MSAKATLMYAKAAALLANTGYSIHEVALQTGFSDQSYFTRVFKKTLNKSPSEVRKP